MPASTAGSRSASPSATFEPPTASSLASGSSCANTRRAWIARRRRRCRRPRPYHPCVPPIDELIRIEPVYLGRLERQGVFTTGLLLEVTETTTRRQYLADQVGATTNDVLTWRDEAQMLNLAGFGQPEHRLLSQSGFEGLRDIQEVDLDGFRTALARGADELKVEMPTDLTIQGWWDQAHTLAE